MAKSLLVFLVSFGFFSFSGATTPEYIELPPPPLKLEVAFAVGSALQSGYLTTQNSASTYNLGVNMLTDGGMMSFEWQNFAVDHDTNEFGMTHQKKTLVSNFAFIPQVRVGKSLPFELYLGVGFLQVGLSQRTPDYLVNYGSFVLAAQARHEINSKWAVHYKTQWFNVSQTVNDQETQFESWSHFVGFGYTLGGK